MKLKFLLFLKSINANRKIRKIISFMIYTENCLKNHSLILKLLLENGP